MRTFAVIADNVTLAGATTVVSIRPPATLLKEIAILGVELGMKSTATSAQARVQLCTYTIAANPTFTGATPTPLDLGFPVSLITSGTAGAAGTAGINASSEGTVTRTVKHAAAFNVLNGWLWVPTPGTEIVLPVGSTSGFSVYFPTAPTDLAGWHCTVKFEER